MNLKLDEKVKSSLSRYCIDALDTDGLTVLQLVGVDVCTETR